MESLHTVPSLVEAPLKSARAPSPGETPLARRVAATWERLGGLFEALSAHTGVAVDTLLAVWMQASEDGTGFIEAKLKGRFEVHVFWHRFGQRHPGLFESHFYYRQAHGKEHHGHRCRRAPGRPWRRVHDNQIGEWRALDVARHLDEKTALESLRMGGPQLLGADFERAGFSSAAAQLEAFQAGERAQVLALFQTIESTCGLDALRSGDLVAFARSYLMAGKRAAELVELKAIFHALLP